MQQAVPFASSICVCYDDKAADQPEVELPWRLPVRMGSHSVVMSTQAVLVLLQQLVPLQQGPEALQQLPGQ
jgi:hypothetical protein